jgi:hypothetical protein
MTETTKSYFIPLPLPLLPEETYTLKKFKIAPYHRLYTLAPLAAQRILPFYTL